MAAFHEWVDEEWNHAHKDKSANGADLSDFRAKEQRALSAVAPSTDDQNR